MKNWALNTLPIVILMFYCCGDPNKIDDGIKTVHFKDTDIIKQTIEYKKGKKNGYLKEYYRDGILKAKQFYVNDTLDDSTLIYHANGRLKTVQVYKNKLKHGCWKEFNKEGQLYSEIFFKEDLMDSASSKYSYRSNHLLTRVRYKHGMKNGAEEHYYPNGKLKSIEYYSEGALCKGTKEYRQNGELINNDFKINISESDAVLLENTLSYYIRLENPKASDKVYQVFKTGEGNNVGSIVPIEKKGDVFVFQYNIPKGGFVMEKVTIAAYRNTSFGNTFVKTQSFNVASNNF